MLQGRLALFLVSDGLLLLSIAVVAIVGPRTRGRPLEATSAPASLETEVTLSSAAE